MIEAEFFHRASDGSLHMNLRGHAGSAPKGQDLVCAAASMLAYTAAQAVQFLYEQKLLTRKPKISLGDGEAIIIATPAESAMAEAMMVFWTAQAGAHVLSHSYPDCVRIKPMTKEVTA